MEYTVLQTGARWSILRSGEFYCYADTHEAALNLCDSLNLLQTPPPGTYRSSDVLNPHPPANESTRRFLGFD